MKIIELDQSSDAWLEWRNGGIGSSDAPSVCNLSPWKTRYDLWEEKVYKYHKGKSILSGKQLKIISEKMRAKESENESSKNRGKKLEPEARFIYEQMIGHEVPPVCGTHNELEFLKVSLDGWNEKKNLFVEIKAPNNKAHSEALLGYVPEYYVPQLLHQFVTSEGTECHYISYHPKFPPGQRMAIVKVNKNTSNETLRIDATLEEQLNYMKQSLTDFWYCVVTGEYKELE